MQCYKNSIFNIKKFKKRKIIIKRNDYLFMMIAIQDNKMNF